MAKSRSATFTKNKRKAFEKNLETFGQYTCEYCSKAPLHRNSINETRMRPDLLTADHIVPLSKNGSNGLSNLAVCCYDCNANKRDK